MTQKSAALGVVLIGRNEGQRLLDCLNSLGGLAHRSVYVDSGSTDGSQAAARERGLMVVDLDRSVPFTAARARNAGFAELRRSFELDYVQFIDGDCTLHPAWIEAARRFLEQRTDVALVCGRRRERYPERSIFNALCDREWNGPTGSISECGGDFLVRCEDFASVNGFRGSLIAGEEPDLCVRLRERNRLVWRLPVEMTLHDANIIRIGQWWKRSVRAGHAFAEISELHRMSPARIWGRNVKRVYGWTAIAAVSLISTALVGPAGLVFLLAYPADICRQALRMGASQTSNWITATFSVLGKFPELQGMLQYQLNKRAGRAGRLIEYK